MRPGRTSSGPCRRPACAPALRRPQPVALGLALACLAAGLSGCRGGSRPDPAAKAGAVPGRIALPGLLVFGEQGDTPGRFVRPRCIAVAPDGSLWIGDETGRIQHLSADGAYLGEHRVPSCEKGKPWGLWAGAGGRLLVADTHYSRVLEFDAAGRIVREFGRYGTGEGEFIYPVGVCPGPGDDIFISEYGGNDRVVKVAWTEGRVLGSWGREGETPGAFRRPSDAVWDAAHGRLLVADALCHRIQIFDADGRLLAVWGREGKGRGELQYPYGLGLGPDGRLWVAEYGNNRVQCFDPDGRSLLVWGGPGRGPGRLSGPRDVAVDAAGRVYVTDGGNHRVQRFIPDFGERP